ncbi:uncharacterized protein LOC144099993 [Amblyomma americanum]
MNVFIARGAAMLAFAATMLLLGNCVNAAYRVKVPVVRGYCKYQERYILLGRSLQLSDPCESVQCIQGRGGGGNAVILSCNHVAQSLLSKLKGRGEAFPYCCKRAYLPQGVGAP